MANQITITIQELKELLDAQKKTTCDYLCRNMSVYHWYNLPGKDINKGREELQNEVFGSDYPEEYRILKKYVK